MPLFGSQNWPEAAVQIAVILSGIAAGYFALRRDQLRTRDQLKEQLADNTAKTEVAAKVGAIAATVAVDAALLHHEEKGTNGAPLAALVESKRMLDQIGADSKGSVLIKPGTVPKP